MKTVYGYIRVSTAKQGEGVSLAVQKDAIERYAEQYNLEITRWFEEKETAAKLGRPLFNSMMKMLKEKKASGVIIHKIDRSARNLKDWADLGNLIDQGVEVHFAHESLDLQARGGRLSADIQAVIAADYIRNLRQEAIKGLYGRLKQGVYPFQAPIGYKNNGKGKLKTIDPMYAPLVKKAFELYATKKFTLHTLKVHMYSMGLRNVRGGRMEETSLAFMLHNPFYIGIMKVKGQTFNGIHDTFITPGLFNRVQAILRSKDNQKIRKHDFLYSKRITCAICGYSLIAERQKGHVYYRCHTKNCVTKGIRETTVEGHLLDVFSAAQLKPDEVSVLDELLQEEEHDSSAVQQELLQSIRLQKAHLKQKLQRLMDTFIEGDLERDLFLNKKELLLVNIKEKESAEHNIEDDKGKIFIRVRKFLELAKNLISTYQTGILEEKRELVEIATSNLSVEGKKLVITMQLPFEELCKRHDLGLGAHKQDRNRTSQSVFVSPNSNTLEAGMKPLSRDRLKPLLKELLHLASELPDDTKTDYGV